ncbi:hypothetical protein [Nostoc sp. 'Peltigera membranacea cyanobiont' 232]|uniref:hypothetical protein n=1 Tax=Nostoc sp. 'Peltigera membranacea cyanobiont' 232 TaxID=2014531 RepID=UPI000B95A33A|nr:hypothetical protein [Nostoc sp. 'Peltigera membranacea cyanobiont' 232]OYE02603.1 hypothetical protein CDG79_22890 [Nostoc sp. 'Peltigera membranacea cyanobiont' 232]
MSDLVKLEFTPLTHRYETTAIFKDSEGQEFLIKISSCSKEKIETITKKCYFSAKRTKILPLESNVQEQDFVNNNDNSLELEKGLKIKNTNILPIDELELDVKSINSNQVPYNFKFAFEHEAQGLINGEQIAFKFNNPNNPDIISGSLGSWVTAIIKVTKNQAEFIMLAAKSQDAADNDWKEVGKTGLISISTNGPNGRGTGIIKHRVKNDEKFFKIKIQGEPGSIYTIDGSWDVN